MTNDFEQLIQTKISNLVEQQFPSFYQDEGSLFIQFVKAYYEWMEEERGVIFDARSMMDYTDIDTTLDEFLSHFQKKYLYGIPFNVIISKRFLLKHVLDVYRSKGSIQAYKLLFRLIYNEEVDVYLPGVDLIRPSDGTWVQPRYLEVTDVPSAQEFVGKTILGLSSGTTAVVESYIREPVNQSEIVTLFISNVNPRGGDFNKGEKIINVEDRESDDISTIVTEAPSILGSLQSIDIINGGQDFAVGDILAVVHRDLTTDEKVSYGVRGKLKVTSVAKGNGQISFTILEPGYGVTANAGTFIYNDPADTTGSGARFSLNPVAFAETVYYDNDLVGDYDNVAINAASYSMSGNASANESSPIGASSSWSNGAFGAISTLGGIRTGTNYTRAPFVFVRDVVASKAMAGNVTFNVASNTVTGVGTNFSRFVANDCIILQANGSSTAEKIIVASVANNTSLTLYSKPSSNSTTGATYKIAPAVFPAAFATYEPLMEREDGTTNGLNSLVFALPGSGNNIVESVRAVDSGKGYVQNEFVTLYLADGLSTPTIVEAGTGYSNGEALTFTGGNPLKPAIGFVTTNANGSITETTYTYSGSGYQLAPMIGVRSANGTGASFTVTIEPFNTDLEVTGRVVKGGVGLQRGYWTTTRGFLDNDKRVQDSYFWQDFSYELQAAVTLDKYRSILYDTFHIAGTMMFGKYLLKTTVSSPVSIGYSSTTPTIS